jgi:hypothetical protein
MNNPSAKLGQICLLLITFMLASCVIPDPVYQQNHSKIQDVEYDASKISGDWMQVGKHAQNFNGTLTEVEDQLYLSLREGGAGLMNRVHKFNGAAKASISERKCTWKYLGHNKWRIIVRNDTARVVQVAKGYTMNPNRSLPPEVFVVRYFDGRLYPTNTPNTFVRATDSAIKRQLANIRAL